MSDCSVQDNMNTLEISELVGRAKSGDVPAFENLYRLYGDRIYNFARQVTGSADDAADVLQETFIRAWRALPKLRSESTFGVWLHKIALNLARDTMKKGLVLQDPIEMEIESHAPGPEQAMVASDKSDAVRRAVDSLGEDHKLAVTMHYMEGMEVEAIAEVLGIPRGTVMSRLSRAREILRRKLAAYVEE